VRLFYILESHWDSQKPVDYISQNGIVMMAVAAKAAINSVQAFP
jgi:hypothetical protein